jgi:hypothetical protein
MRHEPTGLDRWANADPSLHCNRIDPQPDGRWYDEWIQLLKVRDYEAAERVRRVSGGEEGDSDGK